MTDARDRGASDSPAGARGRRYRRHDLALPDGGRLRLGVDGVIERQDADGTTMHSWHPGDPEWPNQAIRFGLRPQPPTVAPHSERVADTRLPGA